MRSKNLQKCSKNEGDAKIIIDRVIHLLISNLTFCYQLFIFISSRIRYTSMSISLILQQILIKYNCFSYLSMNISSAFTESVLLALEQYALSEDKVNFLSNLPAGIQKNFINALNLPYSKDLKLSLLKAGIPDTIAEEISSRKQYQYIQKANSVEDISQIIEVLKKAYSVYFNIIQPVQKQKKEVIRQAKEQKDQFIQESFSSLYRKEYPSIQDYLKQIVEQNQNNFQAFSDFAMRNLPESQLFELSVDNKIYLLTKTNLLPTFQPTFLVNFIKLIEKQRSDSVQFHNINYERYIQRLPQKHINQLFRQLPHLALNASFIDQWFSANFVQKYPFLTEENERLSFSRKQEKRSAIEECIKEIEKIDKSPLRDQIIRQLELQHLIVDLSLDDHNLERFLNYFNVIRTSFPYFKMEWSLKKRNQGLYYQEPLALKKLSNSLNMEQNSLIENYLVMILRNESKDRYEYIDKKMQQIFNFEWYQKVKEKTLLSKGEDESISGRILTETQKLELRQEKILLLSKNNKKFFKVDQDVTLKLEIKNISKLIVKVYQVNLQKQYFQNKKQLQQTAQLHFIDPTFQFVYEIQKLNPYKRQIYEIPFKDIQKERGVYFIDIEGGPVSARAVIRKGAIFCNSRITIAGVELKFYEESGKRIEDLNLWLRGQLIRVKDYHLIPFGSTEENLEIIAVAGQYAEKIKVKIPKEQYRLQVLFYENSESFIMGSKAKIIVNPRLYLVQPDTKKQTLISLKLLKNVQIYVEIIDHQNIKSFMSFDNVGWSYERDYIIEIPIRTFLRSISIHGSGQIQLFSGNKQILKFTQQISIYDSVLNNQGNQIKNIYLRRNNGSFTAFVYGLGGEPIPRQTTHVKIKNRWVEKWTEQIIQTDQKGEINLGPLQFVDQVELIVDNIQRAWKIGNFSGKTQMSTDYYFKEGEKIVIPLPPTDYQIQFDRDLNIIREDLKAGIEIVNRHGTIINNCLQIQSLPEGTYNLQIFSLRYNGRIKVISGQQWQHQDQIYDREKSTVYQFQRSSNNFIHLGEAKIEDLKNSFKRISIPLIKPNDVHLNKDLKAHILAYNFIPSQMLTEPIAYTSKNGITIRKFQSKGNSFLSNKKLSEQASYVLNRKQQKQYVGNNLEKPHILLNRIKVKDTVQKEQQMKQQENYSQQVRADDPFCDLLSFGGMGVNSCGFNVGGNVNSHNNFLQFSGVILDNIKTNHLQFLLPNYYSFISVVLVSTQSQMIRNYSIDQINMAKKNISHFGLPKERSDQYGWSMSREIYLVEKGQPKKLNRASKWMAVSMSNIIKFAKAQGWYLDEWVEKWNTYSEEEKLFHYNKNPSHELNSYIKHQDHKFFDKYVGPYIKNKVNKTLVDLCLLQDPSCHYWSSIQYFQQLNAFEKVLIIEFLSKKGQIQLALVLAKSMQLEEKTKKQSFSTFKDKFQSVINAEIKPIQINRPPPPSSPSMYSYAPPPHSYGYPPPPPPPPVYHPMLNYSQMAYSASSTFGAPQTGVGGFFGSSSLPSSSFAPPPPPPPGMALFSSFSNQSQNRRSVQMSFGQPSYMQDERSNLIQKRSQYVQQFKEIQKTQQFTEVTYDKIKDQNQANKKSFVEQNKFWSDLAIYIAEQKNKNIFTQQMFISQSFIHLKGKLSFTLAASFLCNALNPDYQIKSEGSQIILHANKPFLLFIKQISEIPFQQKVGVTMNQRFVDPNDRCIYEEDGSQIEKQVDELIVGKVYQLQTFVTNTSSRNMEVQLLIDIPEGAIPLSTKEYTSIINFTISSYSTKYFTLNCYFPFEGEYSLFPANACYIKNVIAKAENLKKFRVNSKRKTKKLDNLQGIIEQGQIEDILQYASTKNVFDSNVFKPSQILWVLKDKAKFEKITEIFRKRGYINKEIWRFGILHGNLQSIKEFISLQKQKNPFHFEHERHIKIFQYFPYYSSRVHKYENENKSKIRNVQFKQTYYRFLVEEVAFHASSQKPNFKLAASYFLVLQDRIDQASNILRSLPKQGSQQYELQLDYLESFLDMYEGFPNFGKARKICEKYSNYPIKSWRLLFNQIKQTLHNYDNAEYKDQQNQVIQYKTTYSNEGSHLKINIPENQRVQVFLFSYNLELSFSLKPFDNNKVAPAIKPVRTFIYEPGQSRSINLQRPQDLKDVLVQIFQSGKSTFLRKVQTFFWTNPSIKVKINEKKGSLQVFYKNKASSGSYCKVYSKGIKGEKFYRDGYTDMTGTFKYALSELNQIDSFSILCVTDFGGVIHRTVPPSDRGELEQ